MEASLKILFRTKDLSQVKSYLCQQWTKLLTGQVNVSDFIIAKEVRLGTYKNPPVGAQLVLKEMEKDPQITAEYAERIPYVVVYMGPQHRLKDAIVSPHELVNDSSLKLHGTYYIEKQIIPAISRLFQLVGVGKDYIKT